MNNQFDELANNLTRLIKRWGALKKFGIGCASLGLVALLAVPAWAGNPSVAISTVLDPAGDTVFPYDLYDGDVPPYLDMVEASVGYGRGIFRFEVRMAAQIPADADPHFTPNANHLGPTFGILTGPKKNAEKFKFLGQPDTYHFNFLVGALYSVSDNGLGLALGWTGFLLDMNTFTVVEIPLKIRGKTLVFETSAASLGNPNSFDWAVGAECDPVPDTVETKKTRILVDFLPDHGYAAWPAK